MLQHMFIVITLEIKPVTRYVYHVLERIEGNLH